MQKHIDKTQTGKSQPAAAAQATQGKAAPQLEDNRPQSIIQQQQAAALANKQSSPVPVQQKANTTGLPDQLKSGIEDLSGHSMDDVKVHYNSSQPAQLNAHAYAQGADIHIASGQEKQLPHEAWHVVQQKQGRVKPTMQLKPKVNINDDKALEKEADVMGTKAMSHPLSFIPDNRTFVPAAGPVQYRMIAQLAKRIKTVSGHGKLRRNNKNKRMIFKVPKGRSVMRPAPPGATLGDMSMLLNTMKNPKREDLIKLMKVSTTSDIWKNKNVISIIKSKKKIPKTKLQGKILDDLETGKVIFDDLQPGQKRSLTSLESKPEFEEWSTSHVSQHSFKKFGEGEKMDDMVLTPFEDKLRSNKKNNQNEYVENETMLSEYIDKDPEKDFMVNACSYDPEAEFTGFQIDKK